jgi:hypothetical protein
VDEASDKPDSDSEAAAPQWKWDESRRVYWWWDGERYAVSACWNGSSWQSVHAATSPAHGRVDAVPTSKRSIRAASVAKVASAASLGSFFLGLFVGLLGADVDPPMAVGVVVVGLLAIGFGLGWLGLTVAARGLRPQPDGVRAKGFGWGMAAAILVVVFGLTFWAGWSEAGAPAIFDVVVGADMLLGVLAGLVWPLNVRPRLGDS